MDWRICWLELSRQWFYVLSFSKFWCSQCDYCTWSGEESMLMIVPKSMMLLFSIRRDSDSMLLLRSNSNNSRPGHHQPLRFMSIQPECDTGTVWGSLPLCSSRYFVRSFFGPHGDLFILHLTAAVLFVSVDSCRCCFCCSVSDPVDDHVSEACVDSRS